MQGTEVGYGWLVGKQDTTIGALRRAAEHAPDFEFLDFPDTAATYAELFGRAMRMANGLRSLGVGPGDTVATVLDNNIEAVTALFAVNSIGAIIVPLNTALKGEFLRHQIADARCRIVLAESDYAERVLAVMEGLPDVTHLFCRGSVPTAAASPPFYIGPITELYSGDSRDRGRVADPGELSMLIYTAGTTGPAKGCMISHNQACNLGRQVTEMAGRQPHERLWTPLPLFHVNALSGSVLSTVMLMGSVSITSRFSLSRFWGEIERSGARMVSLLGTMIPLIARMDDNAAMRRCYGQIRIALGAPFPHDVSAIWQERFGVEVAGAPGYGNSEAAMIVSAPLRSDPIPNASGRRNDDFDVRIFDEHDRELPANTVGEVVCRPKRPHVMFEGYWNRPDATTAVMRNLWYHTGDLGQFDESGNFFFVDRKKDYLRRGGENISSFEMETTFLHHPDVVETAVHAVPSEVSEDEVKVTAVLDPDARLTEEALCLWSMDRVPYYAVPRYIEFREALPKNAVGRVLKYQLRDEGVTTSTWDRAMSDIAVVKR